MGASMWSRLAQTLSDVSDVLADDDEEEEDEVYTHSPHNSDNFSVPDPCPALPFALVSFLLSVYVALLYTFCSTCVCVIRC